MFSRWNRILIKSTSWDLSNSILVTAILDFALHVWSFGHNPYLIVGPRKHWYSHWNFVAILCTNWDKRNRSKETAILDFPLSVSSRLTVQHYHYPYLIVGPRKHWHRHWNFAAILCTSWYICNRSLEAAILHIPLPVTFLSLHIISITPRECP